MATEEVYQKSVYTGDGIPVGEFNAALDRFLTDATGELDTFVRMSKKQQFVFQEVRKSFNRLNKKINLYGYGRNQGE
jgi:hypothetical protein